MRIWVDADACPGVIKEILFRAAERAAVSLTLVANKPLRVPRSPHIRTEQVAGGFDVADRWLAGAVSEKGAQALNPRGELYTANTIRERLSVRDFMVQLRGSGVNTGGPPALRAADRHAFAQHLDRLLSKRVCGARCEKCHSRRGLSCSRQRERIGDHERSLQWCFFFLCLCFCCWWLSFWGGLLCFCCFWVFL